MVDASADLGAVPATIDAAALSPTSPYSIDEDDEAVALPDNAADHSFEVVQGNDVSGVVVGGDGFDEEEDDLESLSAKACALASKKVPDYAGAFNIKNKKYKSKKHRDKVLSKKSSRDDDDPSSILLANKTSNILSNFKDYISEIDAEMAVSPKGADLLSPTNYAASPANNGSNSASCSPVNVPVRSSGASVASAGDGSSVASGRSGYAPPSFGGSGGGGGGLAREWSYDGPDASQLKSDSWFSSLQNRKPFGGRSLLLSLFGKKGTGEYMSETQGSEFSDSRHAGNGGGGDVPISSWESMSAAEGGRGGRPLGRGGGDGGRRGSYLRSFFRSRNFRLLALWTAFLCAMAGAIVGVARVTSKAPAAVAPSAQGGESAEVPKDVVPAGGAGGGEKEQPRPQPRPAAPGTPIAEGGAPPFVMPVLTHEDVLAYESDVMTYLPREFDRPKGWRGRTYAEASEFCSELPSGKDGSYGLCPYEAVCPLGPDTQPVGGYKGVADSVIWIPLADKENDWVQIGIGNACVRYANEHPSGPGWGLTGEGEDVDDMTWYLMCCEAKKEEAGKKGGVIGESPYGITKEQDLSYEKALETYLPISLDRSDGWNGNTYAEAYALCSGLGDGYALCPYDAVCPLGPDTQPVGGYRGSKSDGEKWMPVSDEEDEWVQVSVMNACIRYTYEHPDVPEWGLTGSKAGEKVASHVMCCVDKEAKAGTTFAAAEAAAKAEAQKEEEEMSDKDKMMAYEYASKKYHPIVNTAEDGWTGTTYAEAKEFCWGLPGVAYDVCPYDAVCPLGPYTEPLAGYEAGGAGEVWMPLGDEENGWVNVAEGSSCVPYSAEHEGGPAWGLDGGVAVADGSASTPRVMCCQVEGTGASGELGALAEEEAQSGEILMFDRASGWSGQTFLEAIQFCASLEGYHICPYDAVCPSGPMEPLYGFMSDPDDVDDLGTWIPVSSGENAWVSLSPDRPCMLYSFFDTDNPQPEWGVTGEGNEVMTRNIMCCKGSPLGGAEESYMYENDATKFKPIWYSRDEGWAGETWDQAVTFCEMNKMSLCNYDAYCPMADFDVDLGGLVDEPDGSWAPIGDAKNAWVAVGAKDTCKPYEIVNGGPPKWGITGGNESMTRHIMCCQPGGEVDESQEAAPTSVELTENEVLAYEGTAEEYQPIDLDRTQGWNGITYDEAAQLCYDLDGGKHTICPYEAVCPLGPNSQPLGGYKDDADEMWMPILDKQNDWVRVSSTNSCRRYSDENQELPSWGAEDASKTANVMCCKVTKDDLAEDYDLAQWFSRSSGWDGQTYAEAVEFCAGKDDDLHLCSFNEVCPFGTDTESIYGYAAGGEDARVPVSDADNGWVDLTSCMMDENPEWGVTGKDNEEITRNILCCPGSVLGGAEEMSLYETAASKFVPASFSRKDGWVGTSWDEAVLFCFEQGQRILCPYEAYCPMSDFDAPINGVVDEPNGAWAPIGDAKNAWTSLSAENTCEIYSAVNGKNPEWGATGGNEELTRHIMCCGREKTSSPTPLPTFQPTPQPSSPPTRPPTRPPTEEPTRDQAVQWFDRSSGWDGQTYANGVTFCASTLADHHLCSYNDICPNGASNEPVYGYVGSGKEAWIPLSDGDNDWVDLNSCKRYFSVNPSNPRPEWGITGENNEEITRNVMCCPGSPVGGAEEIGLYEVAAYKFNPTMYSRENGWTGTTYDEAVLFCFEQGQRSICPYEAYCPMSDYDIPLNGVVDEPIAWAPIGDVKNAWTSLSSENTCEVYSAVTGENPTWGITGGDEEITRYVMCCGEELVVTESPTTKPTPAPSPPPTKIPTPNPTPKSSPLPSSQPTPPPTPSANKPADATVQTGSTAVYQSVLKFNPIWYDRSSGWNGNTYDDAFEFCTRSGPDYDVCPYDVYCPKGSGSQPHGGVKDEPKGSWAPVGDSFNEWVRVSTDNSCVRYSTMNSGHPEWGLTGVDNEEITRHVMCCQMDNFDGDVSGSEVTAGFSNVQDVYAPTWYQRDEVSADGWIGKTYSDAITFCAEKDSGIPCPYEAYCPQGSGGAPLGGSREAEVAWAPIMDAQNGWVNVGSGSNACELYSEVYTTPPLWGILGRHTAQDLDSNDDVKELTAHLMCCREPVTEPNILAQEPPTAETRLEQGILDSHHPIWYSREDGYQGTTHEDAAAFCNSMGEMVLCPREAYCPGDSDKPLFLGKDAFSGEQWAPVAASGTQTSEWIQVGVLDGISVSTCAAFDDVKGMKPAGWTVDSAGSEMKENVMCCMNPKHLQKEDSFAKDLDVVWLDSTFGWNGGSHADATKLCQRLGNKRLCPYTAYCPHGPGQPVMKGHIEDFNLEGEQWAPVHRDGSNYWVQIGRKYDNSATTCMDNWELEGLEPSWGLTNERADLKKHVMCCTF